MKVLRTPAERFAEIPDYPFAENWLDIDLGEPPTSSASAKAISLTTRASTPTIGMSTG